METSPYSNQKYTTHNNSSISPSYCSHCVSKGPFLSLMQPLPRHRSVNNFLMNLIAALGAYCFFDNKPEAIQGYCIEETKQFAYCSNLIPNQNKLFTLNDFTFLSFTASSSPISPTSSGDNGSCCSFL